MQRKIVLVILSGIGDIGVDFLLFIRELIETAPCETSAFTLYKVALNLCEKLAEGHSILTDKNKNMYDLTRTVHQLLCQVSTYCSEGKET